MLANETDCLPVFFHSSTDRYIFHQYVYSLPQRPTFRCSKLSLTLQNSLLYLNPNPVSIHVDLVKKYFLWYYTWITESVQKDNTRHPMSVQDIDNDISKHMHFQTLVTQQLPPRIQAQRSIWCSTSTQQRIKWFHYYRVALQAQPNPNTEQGTHSRDMEMHARVWVCSLADSTVWEESNPQMMVVGRGQEETGSGLAILALTSNTTVYYFHRQNLILNTSANTSECDQQMGWPSLATSASEDQQCCCVCVSY